MFSEAEDCITLTHLSYFQLELANETLVRDLGVGGERLGNFFPQIPCLWSASLFLVTIASSRNIYIYIYTYMVRLTYCVLGTLGVMVMSSELKWRSVYVASGPWGGEMQFGSQLIKISGLFFISYRNFRTNWNQDNSRKFWKFIIKQWNVWFLITRSLASMIRVLRHAHTYLKHEWYNDIRNLEATEHINIISGFFDCLTLPL